jgi:integrase
MPKEILTARSVEAWKPGDKRVEVADAKAAGLYLVVAPSGAKSWACRYRFAGRPAKLTLGSYPTVGLADARRLARDALLEVASGRDPSEAKRQAKAEKPPEPQREPDTVARMVGLYIDRHCKRNTRSWRETERLFGLHVLPAWGEREIRSIERRDVRELVDGIVDGGKPVQANRVLAALNGFFNWTVGRDILEVSPGQGVKRPTKEAARDRVLSDDELRAVWTAAGDLSYPAGPLVQLLILTGARRDEARELQRREIDLAAGLWRLPADRSKNREGRVIPLSRQAVDLLSGLPTFVRGDFVFSCDGGASAYSNLVKPKRRLDAASGVTDWILHDLRRSTATGLGDLGVAGETIARVLGHTERAISGVTARYARADHTETMRRALQAWADRVDSLGNRSADNVVALSEARA